MRLLKYLNESKLEDWNTYLQKVPMLRSAVKVLEKIESSGYKAWIVGGTVRDIILGTHIHDVDICSNIPIEELSKMYRTIDIGKSKDFGIVTVGEGGFHFEVANLRSDGKYVDGRRPESVTLNVPLETDLGRRDLTVNAMAIDRNGNVIDHFNGLKDIKSKILRTVGNPFERFGEDYLRIMRVARFASKLGFDIDKDTKNAAKKLSGKISKLSPERIRDEILKAASQSGDKFADYIVHLDKIGVLKHILPHVKNLQFYKENLTHHPETKGKGGTVWAHTLEALRISGTDDPIKNLSILLHDIGKGITYGETGGLPHYHGHEERGIELVKELSDRLRMSNKDRDTLLFAVSKHMSFHRIEDMKPSKVFKLVADDNWDVLVAVAKADDYSRGKTFMDNSRFEKCLDAALKIKEAWGADQLKKTMKFVDGKRVMELLNIKPGKRVGEVIAKTTEWILNNSIKDQDEIDRYILDAFK